MPIYEFICSKCKKEFETLIIRSDDKPECPSCGSTKAKKRMSSFGFSSGNKFTSSAGKGSCSGCTSSNCSSCS